MRPFVWLACVGALVAAVVTDSVPLAILGAVAVWLAHEDES